MRPQVFSETGMLSDVVMADIAVFQITDPINVTQEKYYRSDPPELEQLLFEQQLFVHALEAEGVRIHWADSLPSCPFQHATRDIGAVIGNTFIKCKMRKSIRSHEILGIGNILREIEGEIASILDGVVEGGDILVDEDIVYVGLSQRTDRQGLISLSGIIGDRFKVVPLRLVDPFLHLDTVLNFLPGRVALLYAPAFAESSDEPIRRLFDVIEVTEEEQETLAVNVLTISPNVVVTDKRSTRLNSRLRMMGMRLYELECTHTTRIGRSFRCSTLPLVRQR